MACMTAPHGPSAPMNHFPATILPDPFALPSASLALVVLHSILNAPDLRVLAHLLRIEKIHLPPQLTDVVLQERLQVVTPSRSVHLLQ